MDNKYIIFDGTTGFDGFIFPPYEKHDDFARRFPEWTPISAGFVKISGGFVSCYGKSVSIKLAAQPGDERAFKYLIGE